MSRPRRRTHPPMRLELCVPTTQFLPGIQVDPLKALTGRSLADLLAPVLEGEPRPEVGQTLYPLALPDGVGVAVPLGGLGEVGIHHAAQYLQVTAPGLVAMFLGRLPHQVGPPEVLQTSAGRVSRYTLAPPAGSTFSLAITGTLTLTLTRL